MLNGCVELRINPAPSPSFRWQMAAHDQAEPAMQVSAAVANRRPHSEQPFKPLFLPYRLDNIELNNRLVMAPMARSRALEQNGPNPIAATHYAQRASAGLIRHGATQVSPQGVGYIRTPGIHSAEQVAGWMKIAEAAHRAGGKISVPAHSECLSSAEAVWAAHRGSMRPGACGCQAISGSGAGSPAARSRDIRRRMRKPQAMVLMRSGSRYMFLSRVRAPKAPRPRPSAGRPLSSCRAARCGSIRRGRKFS